jgi:hypothetical protein
MQVVDGAPSPAMTLRGRPHRLFLVRRAAVLAMTQETA